MREVGKIESRMEYFYHYLLNFLCGAEKRAIFRLFQFEKIVISLVKVISIKCEMVEMMNLVSVPVPMSCRNPHHI